MVARASTLKLIDKSDQIQPLSPDDRNAGPKASHWVDETEEDTVLVIEQPPHQICAAIGGIMASRMKFRGVRACVVGGRVRDLAELKSSGLPVSDFSVSQLALHPLMQGQYSHMHFLSLLVVLIHPLLLAWTILACTWKRLSLMHITNRSGLQVDQQLG